MTTHDGFTVLVVAKAPEPGKSKTRLCPPLSEEQAGQIAAAALLDTLDTAQQAVGGDRSRVVVSWDGDVDRACSTVDISAALKGCVVVPQRGGTFAERLVNAHLDAAAARADEVVVQIGMDTPQLPVELLQATAARLQAGPHTATLGLAHDGGWWVLGLVQPQFAKALEGVSMSTSTTGDETRRALTDVGAVLELTGELRDVDTWSDALSVAAECPASRFAEAVAQVLR